METIRAWLSSFNKEYATISLSEINRLVIENERIEYLTHEINRLTNLQELFLGNNKIKQLPKTIKKLTKLTALHLNDNELTKIPTAIHETKQLTYLNIRNNQIRKIPESIGQLTNLKGLNIEHNQLTSIPNSLCELIKKGTSVYLKENQFKEIVGNEQNYTYIGEEQKYTILNDEYIYMDTIGDEMSEDVVKHLSELTQEELSHLIIKQSYNDQIIMLNNYQTAGVKLTSETTINLINQITGDDYTKKPLITYTENNEIIKNVYNEKPQQKELLEKIIKLCPKIAKMLNIETKVGDTIL